MSNITLLDEAPGHPLSTGFRKHTISICPAGMKHHSRHLGTTGGGVDNSPVTLVETGVEPVDYLDQFPPESIYFEQIQRFKKYVLDEG